MIRRALLVAACALLVAAAPMLGAALRLGGGSLAVFEVPVQLPIRQASVDLKPESLERRSRGSPVTAIIEATAGSFDVRQIVAASIRLCLSGPLCDSGAAPDGKPKVGDADGDGTPDLKVVFARGDVLALVASVPAPATVTFVVSAVVADGSACSASAKVRLVDPDPTDAPGSPPSSSPFAPAPLDGSPNPSPSGSPDPTGAPSDPVPTSPGDSPVPSSEPSDAPSSVPTSAPAPPGPSQGAPTPSPNASPPDATSSSTPAPAPSETQSPPRSQKPEPTSDPTATPGPTAAPTDPPSAP